MGEAKIWEREVGQVTPVPGSLYRVEAATGKVFAINPRHPEFIKLRKIGQVERRKKQEIRNKLQRERQAESTRKLQERRDLMQKKILEMEEKLKKLG